MTEPEKCPRCHEDMKVFHRALCFERAYGGSAILIGANDFETDMAKPYKGASCNPDHWENYCDCPSPQKGERAKQKCPVKAWGAALDDSDRRHHGFLDTDWDWPDDDD